MIAAFFDLDDTILKGNSGIRTAAHYFLSGRVGFFLSLRVLVMFLMYYFGRKNPEEFFRKVYFFLKGRDYEEEKAFCDSYFDRVLSRRLYSQALARMKWHKRKGHFVAVITNSLELMVGRAKEYLPADLFIGSLLEVNSGVISGRTKRVVFGREKARVIRSLAKEYRLNLARSYAYSDNNSDISMLKAVGIPVATNPKWKMRRHALASGWDIGFFR